MPDRRSVGSSRNSRWLTVGMLAVTLTACGGNSGKPSAGGTSSTGGGSALRGDPVTVVAGAAQRTTDAGNAKVDLTGTLGTGAQARNVTGTGVIDFAGKSFTLAITVPGREAIQERFVDGVIYVNIPAQEAAQFGGKPWLEIDPTTFGTTGQNPFGSLDSSNPSEILNALRGAGDVTTLGTEDVRGLRTTHYRAEIDVAEAADKQGFTAQQKAQLQQSLGGRTTLPEDVWLDEQGLVRRLTVAVTPTPTSAGTSAGTSGASSPAQSLSTAFRLEFYDYGRATRPATAPPADQVADLERILGQFGSSSGSPSG